VSDLPLLKMSGLGGLRHLFDRDFYSSRLEVVHHAPPLPLDVLAVHLVTGYLGIAHPVAEAMLRNPEPGGGTGDLSFLLPPVHQPRRLGPQRRSLRPRRRPRRRDHRRAPILTARDRLAALALARRLRVPRAPPGPTGPGLSRGDAVPSDAECGDARRRPPFPDTRHTLEQLQRFLHQRGRAGRHLLPHAGLPPRAGPR